MASIRALLFLALSFSMGSLQISDLLITLANENHNNSLIFIAVHAFFFSLIPFTFISAIILLLLQVAIPQSAFFIKHLTMATQILVSATLLVGVPLVVHVTLTEAVVPDTLKIMLIGMAVAAATVYKYNPFKRYFNSAGQTVDSFVPAFTGLRISTGTFLLIDIDSLLTLSYQNHGNPIIPVPIQLFLLSLNCFNFLIAVVLLFLSISVPQTSIPQVLVELLVEAVLAMSFATTGLIGFCMLVAPLVRII